MHAAAVAIAVVEPAQVVVCVAVLLISSTTMPVIVLLPPAAMVHTSLLRCLPLLKHHAISNQRVFS
jgi:hypothetical protein